MRSTMAFKRMYWSVHGWDLSSRRADVMLRGLGLERWTMDDGRWTMMDKVARGNHSEITAFNAIKVASDRR